MTEKEKHFLEAFKVAQADGKDYKFSSIQAFAIAAIDRIEEIGQTSLRAVNPISDLERPLLAAAFKVTADTLYKSLDEDEQEACDNLASMCKTSLIRRSDENGCI